MGEDSRGSDDRRNGNRERPQSKKSGERRVGDVGRALRSIYDDTLRETVPDDFKDLLGKLS